MISDLIPIEKFKAVEYQVLEKEKICLITLNRPKNLNAFNYDMAAELISSFHYIDRDDKIRAVVITGKGDAFCAGADLSGGNAFSRSEPVPLQERRDEGGIVTLAIHRCRKPVIAAINGSAVGVGITVTLAADIRIAAEDAKIGFVFAKRGITPEACSSYFLPKIVGMGKALELTLTAKVFRAKEEENCGLFNYVLKKEEVLPKALSLAKEMGASTSAVSLALTKALLWHSHSPQEAHLAESKTIAWTGNEADALEGVMSFKEKRAPEFTLSAWSDIPEFYPWWKEVDVKSRL